MENYDKEVLDLAMEAGRILLDAGAEIFRVEETIQRIAKAFGIEKCSTFVLSTGIFITAENQEGQIYASVKHIPISGAKLHRIAAVNQLSREIVEGKYSVKEAEERLEIIKHMPGKRGIVQMFASGVGSGCFCYLLGGNLEDMAAAFLSGGFPFRLSSLCPDPGIREKRKADLQDRHQSGRRVLRIFFCRLFLPAGAWKRAGKYSGRFCDASGPGGFSGKCGPGFC